MRNPSLQALFNANEAEFRNTLNLARSTFNHLGERGGHVEEFFRSFLERQLPRRLTVSQGEVIDVAGNRSAQADVLILNEDQPANMANSSSGLYIVEGVSAVGEVKSVLTKDALADTINKGRKLKRLRVREEPGSSMLAVGSDPRRFGACPPFFLFAYSSSISESALEELLGEAAYVPPAPGSHIDTTNDSALPPLDAIFILDEYSVLNY
ncbi:DUF6602 domain-containing protein [Saccharothrix syringae]|uniref:DUF6602 domain-containing protein n=1 Tax=Saccharothrix syringae TaxID=103733 RepID=A0A5Q0GSX2_SACSY|nr:DUF6602 domain-containing protein [Saccharothrix syringae]QFZ16590.1 hypothetical protein EKG83_03100 [Saccharothrix syringae]